MAPRWRALSETCRSAALGSLPAPAAVDLAVALCSFLRQPKVCCLLRLADTGCKATAVVARYSRLKV
jgi:hypothetical protein